MRNQTPKMLDFLDSTRWPEYRRIAQKFRMSVEHVNLPASL